MTAKPNHALQRTAPRVTLAASSLRLSPTKQPARRAPQSLSLGSFGGMNELPPGFECNAPVEGCYSPSEQYWTIRPRAEYRYDAERGWLCIGGPGVDGIEFGLLRGREGVFAYYPIDHEYVLKAPSATDFITGWVNGEITV